MKNRILNQKLLLAAILTVIISLNLGAQNDNEKEKMSTLFGNRDGHIDHGGWAGLNFGYTQIKGNDTYLMGARGGWMIDHHFTIGLAGMGFISDRDYLSGLPKVEEVNLAGGYGGLFLEATIAPFSPVHVTIPVIIGAGGVAYTRSYWYENSWDNHNYSNYTLDSDAYFVFEPGLEIELNLIKFMRFAVGGSYRFTSDISMIESSPKMLHGFNGHFALKFGWF
ncbi:MAG TPA: hypothetical protein VK994_01835 [Bacteroidales bacterium]|nr:hypothetical protein [Bacteroidales bacterium]